MNNPSSRSLVPDVRLREVWAWSMYDFAKPVAQSASPWSRVLQSLREALRYFGCAAFCFASRSTRASSWL